MINSISLFTVMLLKEQHVQHKLQIHISMKHPIIVNTITLQRDNEPTPHRENGKRECHDKNHYTSDDEVKAAVKSWILEKSEEFFSDGMKKLVTRWEKSVSLNGDYAET
jgi:hypothetical protein